MAHKGKYWEQFLWRDLVGEMPSTQAFTLPKYWTWRKAGGTGVIPAWIEANDPVTEAGERIDWDQIVRWYVQINVPTVGDVDLETTITYSPNARVMTMDIAASWVGGVATADRTATQVGNSSLGLFNTTTPWSNTYTTDAARWTWGTGTIQRNTLLQAREYPWPPP